MQSHCAKQPTVEIDIIRMSLVPNGCAAVIPQVGLYFFRARLFFWCVCVYVLENVCVTFAFKHLIYFANLKNLNFLKGQFLGVNEKVKYYFYLI